MLYQEHPKTLLQRLGLKRPSFDFRYGGRTVIVVQYDDYAIVKTGRKKIGRIDHPVEQWWDPDLMDFIREYAREHIKTWREW